MGPTIESQFDNSIMLTRVRFTSTARHSLRFYREYFRPQAEREVVKYRQRAHINYEYTDFSVNLDQVADKIYLEIKCRTWSAKDAKYKAGLMGELLQKFAIRAENLFKAEYVDLVA